MFSLYSGLEQLGMCLYGGAGRSLQLMSSWSLDLRVRVWINGEGRVHVCLCVCERICVWRMRIVSSKGLTMNLSEQKVKGVMERWKEGDERRLLHIPSQWLPLPFLWRVSEAFWVKMSLKRDRSHPPSTLSTHPPRWCILSLTHSLLRYSIKHTRKHWVCANVLIVLKVTASDINVYFWY